MILCGVCQEVLDFYNEDIIVIDDEYVHADCVGTSEEVEVLAVDDFMRDKYQREY